MHPKTRMLKSKKDSKNNKNQNHWRGKPFLKKDFKKITPKTTKKLPRKTNF
jgi:hypothetical protein